MPSSDLLEVCCSQLGSNPCKTSVTLEVKKNELIMFRQMREKVEVLVMGKGENLKNLKSKEMWRKSLEDID